MSARRTLAAVALALLVAAAGVQLLDPAFDERRPPEVDFSEPPAQVAADSATRLEYVDYAYRIDLARDRDGPWEQLRVVCIEHSDREYRKVGPLGRRGVALYGTDSAAFVRPGADGEWRFVSRPEVMYPVRMLSQPFLLDRIEYSSTDVVVDNASMLVVQIDSNPMKFVKSYSGNATVFVNKSDGTIDKVLAEYDTGPTGIRYARFERTTDEPAVSRPNSLGPSLREVLWDLLRGPLFRPFSTAPPSSAG